MNTISMRRGKIGLNQTDFAEHMRVSKTTVSNWENGNITPAVAQKVAEYFNVSPFAIYGADVLREKPQSDGDIKLLLHILSLYAKDEELAKMLRALAIC